MGVLLVICDQRRRRGWILLLLLLLFSYREIIIVRSQIIEMCANPSISSVNSGSASCICCWYVEEIPRPRNRNRRLRRSNDFGTFVSHFEDTVMSTSRSSFRRSPRSTSQASVSSRRMSKSLELPSSLSSDIFRIIHHIILVFCRRVIFAPPKWKIFVFYCLILLGPFLKDVQLIPTTFGFALKINMFNKYISQLGWTCSILLLIPFVYLTSLIYARGHYGLISRHLSRLVIGTVIWYFLTSVFSRVELLTSMCKPLNHRGLYRQACQILGRSSWYEGQTFLYLYALLVINEEVKLYDENWKKVEEASKLNPYHIDLSSSLINQNRLRMFSTPIDILYIALALLTFLWELMLLCTAVYFYNVVHKLCAASLAVFFWLITYHLWFRQTSHSTLAPCAPGDGFITF